MAKWIALLFLFSVFAIGCSQNTKVNQVGSATFQQLLQENEGILLDVRTSQEFNNSHIAKAGNLDFYSPSFKEKLNLLPKNQPIYLYCNTGYRSNKAAAILANKGYSQLYNLKHGIMEWHLMGKPVVVEPNAKPSLPDKYGPEKYAGLMQSDTITLIDFHAPWCSPCLKMMPLIDSLKVEYHGQINIVKINVDASKKLVLQLKLVSVPYLAMYCKGNLLFSKNGLGTREELVEIIESNIAKHNKL